MIVGGIKDIFIIFGSLFAFVLVVGKLVERDGTIQRFLTILILFNMGIYQLISYTLYCNPGITIPEINKWAYILEAAGFMIFLTHGPLQYGYCHSVLSARTPLPERYWLHFLPGIIYAAFYLPFAHIKTTMAIASGDTSLFFPGHDRIYLLSIILTVISYDSYMFICVKRLAPHLSKQSNRFKIFRVMAGVYIFGMIFVSFWPIDILLNINFTDKARMATSLYIIIIYAVSCRYPERMIFVDPGTKKKKYLNTQLQGMNVEEVILQLNSLMHNEKIYKDKITLKDLAGLLNIRQHQLSEILNSYMKTTFSIYINDLRVEEAGHLLRTRADLKIIEIALEVGYDSLSVFYREFKKRTGISPAKSRTQNLQQ